MQILASLDHFADRNDTFPYSFIYFNQWNPYPFHIREAWKKVPLSGGASPLAYGPL